MIFVVEKNKEYILDIVAQGYEGEGIAKIDTYPYLFRSTYWRKS